MVPQTIALSGELRARLSPSIGKSTADYLAIAVVHVGGGALSGCRRQSFRQEEEVELTIGPEGDEHGRRLGGLGVSPGVRGPLRVEAVSQPGDVPALFGPQPEEAGRDS